MSKPKVLSHVDATAPHGGHETLTGAQTKANTAESDAKSYTDTKVGNLSSLNTTTKTDVVSSINELFQDVSNGKNSVASAITGMGQTASGSDTFATLSTKIGNISKDATAVASDILSGKNAYINGSKTNGTMTDYSNGTYNGYSSSISGYNIHPTNGSYGQLTTPINNLGTNLNGKINNTNFKVDVLNLLPGNIKTGVIVGSDTNGAGQVTGTFTSDANASTGDILSGKSGYVNGTKINGTMPSRAYAEMASATWTDGTGNLSLKVPTGAYVTEGAFGPGYVAPSAYDADFIASNIINGANIFGIAGTAASGKRFSSGTYTVTSSQLSFIRGAESEPSENKYYIEVTGLDFPEGINFIAIIHYNFTMFYINPDTYIWGLESYIGGGAYVKGWWGSSQAYAYKHDRPNAYVSNTGFRLPQYSTGTVYWFVWGK